MMFLKAIIKKIPSVHTICQAGTIKCLRAKSKVRCARELIGNLAVVDAIFNLLALLFSFSKMQGKFEIGAISH